jgi:hypothetical protein
LIFSNLPCCRYIICQTNFFKSFHYNISRLIFYENDNSNNYTDADCHMHTYIYMHAIHLLSFYNQILKSRKANEQLFYSLNYFLAFIIYQKNIFSTASKWEKKKNFLYDYLSMM